MAVIAKYEAPQQRATVHYGYHLIKDESVPPHDPRAYFIAKISLAMGDCISTTQHMAVEDAWDQFHNTIKLNWEYGPGAWEDKYLQL